MTDKLPARVGRVPLQSVGKASAKDYIDQAEKRLLELFGEHDADKVNAKRRALLAGDIDWHLYYHLSPLRANLLSWYEFKAGAKVLEVGAGCGAITEELVRRDVKVTALELSARRCLINAHRNHAAGNLEIVAGNLEDYPAKLTFDYVVCVGALEYAGEYLKADQPYEAFLRHLHATLRPGGKLLLATENRMGLKYWAGAREDHSGRYFEGLNSYPNRPAVQTFGKNELNELLSSSKFKANRFYYLYPDYKTPYMVYSDDYYPGHRASFPLARLPSPGFSRPREHFFSEQSAMRHLETNDLFRQLANAFLVEATA
ncbi:class I SAM-dependent methyltransferase [Candidatus Saccharibacteria bacterium]|nr:class I SAM-dependent methyltransferase [Candidatus Saccharibacteria bacterium]